MSAAPVTFLPGPAPIRMGQKGKSALERFDAKWRLDPATGCWVWTAALMFSRGGSAYGVFGQGLAHRFAYKVFRGPIPEGLEIDHLCRRTLCVNPKHLEAVTHAENQKRGNSGKVMAEMHRRKTRCPQGHPYDEANTYRHGGRRYCRTCKRSREAKE